MLTAYVKVSSWTFVGSIGAKHFYAQLTCGKKTVKLTKKLTHEEAVILNERDNLAGYRAGYRSERFDGEQEAVLFAIAEWKKIFPKAQILIRGSHCSGDPQPILDAPADIKAKGNILAKKAEEVGYWEDEKTMRRLCQKWDALVLGKD